MRIKFIGSYEHAKPYSAIGNSKSNDKRIIMCMKDWREKIINKKALTVEPLVI